LNQYSKLIVIYDYCKAKIACLNAKFLSQLGKTSEVGCLCFTLLAITEMSHWYLRNLPAMVCFHNSARILTARITSISDVVPTGQRPNLLTKDIA